jgi:uncharacterized membrane protein YcaP (DUF421 family)
VFFDSWDRIGTLVVAALAAYVALIVVLRTSGKRTLSKLNAFDFVVTIALGSVLATVVLSRSVPLVEGLLAFALLAGLQFVVASVSLRSGLLRGLVKSSPAAVLVDGEPRHDALRAERVTLDELAQAVRKQGAGSFSEIDLVVLETDGTLSVIRDAKDGSALTGLEAADRPAPRDDGKGTARGTHR